MNTKYEFVEGDEKVIAPGVVVKRIRALAAIAATIYAPAVAPGELGGYIQSEENLQVSGDAWVSGNARVSGDGLVFFATNVGTENGTLTVFNTKGGGLCVSRGCFSGSPSEFLAASAAKHDARTRREYELLIEVAASRIEAARLACKNSSWEGDEE